MKVGMDERLKIMRKIGSKGGYRISRTVQFLTLISHHLQPCWGFWPPDPKPLICRLLFVNCTKPWRNINGNRK